MKKLLVLALFVGMWTYTGWCNYHYNLGSFTAEFPDQNHVSFARSTTVYGPIGFLADLIDGNRIWLDQPYTCQQRWNEFKKVAENLGPGYFVHYGNNYDCRIEELK